MKTVKKQIGCLEKSRKKAIRRKKHKDQKHRELSLNSNKLKNSKTETRNTIGALKQTISHIEESKDLVNLKIKKTEDKIENLRRKNPFAFQNISK